MQTAREVAGGLLLALLAGHAAARLDLAPGTADLAPGVAPEAPAPPGARERSERVASYTLRASLDPALHVVRGEGTITWRNASRAPQQELYVHLYLNAFKTTRTALYRAPITGFRGSAWPYDPGRIDVTRFAVREMDGADVWPRERPTTPGDPDDQTDIRVALPRPVAPGEAIAIDVAWEAHLPSITLRTGHHGSFHMVAQWFPKIARLEPDGRWAHFPFQRLSEFYADFGVYDVTIDAPDGFVIGATGRLEREARAGGRVERRYVQEDVHDFAFAAWDGFRERGVVTDEGVALRCLYPPGHDRAAEVELAAARFGLSRFGDAFGRYPYSTLTIVHPPEGAEEAGGMEYPTLITTGGAWYHAYTGVRELERVTLHEVAHQWFYGLVATDEHRHPFLDEGLATYAELDALRALYGEGSAARVLGLALDQGAIYRATALQVGRDGTVGRAAPEFPTGAEYAGLAYARMAMLLATLGGVYGEEAIRGALGRYARAHRFGHPGPEDLLRAVREEAGEGAAEALRVGIFEGGWVDYAVAELSWDGGVLVRRRGTLVMPVDIDLHGADGSVRRVRWEAADRAARIPYDGEAPLVAAVIDPDRRVLLDEDFSDNARRRGGGGAIAPRVLARGSFAAGVALWAIAP
jgi:hypothetical protein